MDTLVSLVGARPSRRRRSRGATRDGYAFHDYVPLRSTEALDDLRSAFDLG
ncbi:hypothetical protein [Streptomyces chiangmaiensis]|uniref:Uncharacterized protein n=1 Tax=Streptomyces chiangmaiensis TaxID=766497 RepID=A0ABU7FMU7_9ACTN|nr:hypothetical protein [Streptomyces chiangmaiensis]MED7825437.1 hypothetical protein [Streptomyces chiangmaiensis]